MLTRPTYEVEGMAEQQPGSSTECETACEEKRYSQGRIQSVSLGGSISISGGQVS